MKHEEIVALIRDGVAGGKTWADFGSGTGNFTRALHELLPDASIIAVDKDHRALRELQTRLDAYTKIYPADFRKPLDLPLLDGVLMANALHWVRDQKRVLRDIRSYLNVGGRLLVVEYDVEQELPYVPYPVGYAAFAKLAESAGFGAVQRVAERQSPSTGVTMMSAIAVKI